MAKTWKERALEAEAYAKDLESHNHSLENRLYELTSMLDIVGLSEESTPQKFQEIRSLVDLMD